MGSQCTEYDGEYMHQHQVYAFSTGGAPALDYGDDVAASSGSTS
jgi:hypothetical protein